MVVRKIFQISPSFTVLITNEEIENKNLIGFTPRYYSPSRAKYEAILSEKLEDNKARYYPRPYKDFLVPGKISHSHPYESMISLLQHLDLLGVDDLYWYPI